MFSALQLEISLFALLSKNHELFQHWYIRACRGNHACCSLWHESVLLGRSSLLEFFYSNSYENFSISRHSIPIAGYCDQLLAALMRLFP
jgi:hypothetical protein